MVATRSFLFFPNSAKIILFASILLLEVVSAQADELSRVTISVKPGPLEVERRLLLEDILEAGENRVGIKAYMSALEEIENLVAKGVSKESIQVSIDSLKSALSNQKTRYLAREVRIIETTPKTISKARSRSPIKTTLKTLPPRKLLTLEEARIYVLRLVNTDRAKYHLAPVTLDSRATVAGQLHTDEMASVGSCSHWDTAGKKPSQRYTEAGGIDDDSENLAYSFGNRLSENHLFAPEELEEMQRSFMNEKAPRDGHRLQILRPEHNKIGIGVSNFVDKNGHSHLCLAQEFINQYGEYSKLPSVITHSQHFDVSGSLLPGLALERVSIDWEPLSKPMTQEQLSNTGSYGNGDLSVTEFYAKLEPEIVKVWTKGGRQHFALRIVPDESWKVGLYYVSIWAKSPKFHRSIQVSTRTLCLN